MARSVEPKPLGANNPLHKLKTGKRRKKGRPRSKYNAKCVDCGKYYHVSPAHMGKICRCPKCRTGMRGKRPDYRETHTCPICGRWKHHKSKICIDCWHSGRRLGVRNEEE